MNACMPALQSEVTCLEGLHEPCIPKSPGTEFTGNFAKNRILKTTTTTKHVFIVFKKRERENRRVKSEVSIPTAPFPSPLESREDPIL